MKKVKKKIKEVPEQVEFDEGMLDFGGIPKDVALTKNIGCASSSTSKKNKSKDR